MQIAIIASNKDRASINIRNRLLESFDFKDFAIIDGNKCYELTLKNNDVRIYTVDKDLIYCERIDEKIVADFYVFISRHSSARNVACLTVHAAGNFGKAEYGGFDKTLGIANASLMKNCLKELYAQAGGFEIAQEATHHGPLLEKPCMFIEVGSDEQGWENQQAAKIVATSIMKALVARPAESAVLAIGGPHYTPNFIDITLNSDISIGHVCAKYNLADLDAPLIKSAMKRTVPKCELVVLDWKGLGSEKKKVVDILDKAKIPYVKSSELKKKFI